MKNSANSNTGEKNMGEIRIDSEGNARWNNSNRLVKVKGEIKSKFDLYKTAKVKDSGMVAHGGEYVRVLGHVNEILIHIEFLNGDREYYHKCHLENFVL